MSCAIVALLLVVAGAGVACYVYRQVGTTMAQFAELEARHKTLLGKEDASALQTPQAIAVYRDLAATWLDATREQVAALNEAGFFLEEYRWVRAQAYAALGLRYGAAYP